jgi:MraZ protein
LVTIYQETVVSWVDGKGRVSIPASYRKVLLARSGSATELVIGYERKGKCLVGYDVQRLAALNAKLEEDFPDSYDPAREAERARLALALNARTRTLSVDDAGRIILPQSFRDFANIRADDVAVFVSRGSRFEIWNATDAKADLEPEAPGIADIIIELEQPYAARRQK